MAWLGLALTIGGFLAYFGAAMQLALFQHVPWLFLAVMVLGVSLAAWQLIRRPTLGAGVATTLSVAAFAFAFWYLFSYSIFDAREARPRIGDAFPVFSLPTSQGGTFRLEDARDKYLLLLFYRGSW
jgi:hypothetical protein